MSRCGAVARPLARQLLPLRRFTTTATARQQQQQQQHQNEASSSSASTTSSSSTPAQQPSPLDLDPDTVLPEFEAPLIKAGKMPVGSRRRRVALRSITDLGLPFEQLPYQAFQEARAVLAADRADKLGQIRTQLGRIARLEGADPAAVRGGQRMRDTRLASLRRHVERLKILADANDPLVKKRFEDGLGALLLSPPLLGLFTMGRVKRLTKLDIMQAT